MYGLLGEKLGHSYSPQIHAMLGDYEYSLFEVERENLPDFIKHGEWQGLNVTIPYKKEVMPYLDVISDNAEKIGSVNTIKRCSDGTLLGDNTDYDGFMYLVKNSKIEIGGKKVLVLGTGGASLAIKAVLHDLGAGKITDISRSGENNYDNIKKHADADIIVNTTPVGMYPNNLVSPVKLEDFTHLEAVFDIIYNPQKTKLVLDAERLGIPAFSGLLMLVAQAKKSSEIWFQSSIPDTKTQEIFNTLSFGMKNLVLIGMPGCGKSSIGKKLSEDLSRELIDTDIVITHTENKAIPDIFKEVGEEGFRKIETEILKSECKKSGKIIATGGGIVTRPENYYPVRQNSVTVFINREISVLPKDGRPLSQQNDLSEMFKTRLPLYRQFCDFEVDGNGTVREVTERIKEVLKK